jgi:hypothetical protein
MTRDLLDICRVAFSVVVRNVVEGMPMLVLKLD